uniref:EGF-like domain-containing protein n=1 Tax=Plectus sambesii TaxID=2011161 RepID=A0A914X8W7_9BILA
MLAENINLDEGYSTGPSPRPQPTQVYWHPSENLPRRNCSDFYHGFCLNNGICFMELDINNIERPNCICAVGYVGKWCSKIVDVNTSLPVMQMERVGTAALLALFLLLLIATCFISLALHLHNRRSQEPLEHDSSPSHLSSRYYHIGFRAPRDPFFFQTWQLGSTPTGSTRTSLSQQLSARLTDVGFLPQEGETTGS